MHRLRSLLVASLVAGAFTPAVLLSTSTPATASGAAMTTYTPGTPLLATITDGTSQAPWNEFQGDSPSTPTDSVLPTYTPGGAQVDGYPNLSIVPGASSGTDGNTPYPSGTVGTPGPLDGYCGSGSNAAESAGSPVRQPVGTTLPLAPAYFPHVVRDADGSLTGYFDYRPKDADEAIVAARSTDDGKSWTYEGEALEQNPNDCPSSDINDDGEGHPNVITVDGTGYLYTLPRAAGDNLGVGMLVHALTPIASDPLAGLPATEETGVDPDDFASGAVDLTSGSPATIGLSDPIGSGPEQLVAGPFVDLTQTPTPNASDVITCTGASGSALSGCTTTGTTAIDVQPGDLVEQVIATVTSNLAPKTTPSTACSSGSTTPSTSGTGSLPCAVPVGPNTTTGDGGLEGFGISFTNPDNQTMGIFNANAPNRADIDGVAVYCNQANAYPTNKIENCTTGPGGSPLLVSAGDPVTSDPIVPATAQQTSGLVAPDGIVGVLPSFPGVPSGDTAILYTEKILNYFIAGETSGGGKKTTTFASLQSGGINFIPGSSFPQDMPSSISTSNPVTVYLGDLTLASATTPAAVFVPVTCTALTTGGAPASGYTTPTDTLTGCTVPTSISGTSYASSNEYDANSFIAAPGASLVSPSTLALTGEGKASNAQKLFKNNEDLTLLRVAYTSDGINFSDAGLANQGIISGADNSSVNGTTGAVTCTSDTAVAAYDDLNDPCATTSPSNLNAYDTPGSPLATEMRYIGSAGTIVTDPDGDLGLFLSGAWAGDGDSDAFNQIFYAESSDGGQTWSVPVDVISTDYTFAASVAEENNPTQPIGISAYYSGRAYAPSVVVNPDGTLTMLFAGDRFPKSISSAGTVLGTGTAKYTVGPDDPTLYRNILEVTLTASTSPTVATGTAVTSSDGGNGLVGSTVTYTATVAPSTQSSFEPTGAVAFSDSNGPIASCAAQPFVATSSSDTATCTTTEPTTSGDDTVSAAYSGDANYATSTGTFVETVATAPTNTTVTSSDGGNGVVGESITYTATVVPSGAAITAEPTGSVAFSDSNGLITSCGAQALSPGGTATCTVSYASPTQDAVTAAYSGDQSYSPSTSQPFEESVAKAGTTTVVTSSDAGSSVVGAPVTYTANVGVNAPGSGTPTGSVDFSDASGPIASCQDVPLTASGAACSMTHASTVGSDTITAAYSGDPSFLASISAPFSESTTPAATTVTVRSADGGSSVVGAPVTYTASVAVSPPGTGNPTGTVAFSGTSGPVAGCGSQAVNPATGVATCTTSYAAPTTDQVVATYSGDGNYTGSTSSSYAETIAPASTSVVVTSSDSGNGVAGTPTTYGATVAVTAPGSGAPTGTVAFTDNGQPIAGCGAQPLTAGQATCTVTYTASQAGEHDIVATYSGDPSYTGSTSSAFAETVRIPTQLSAYARPTHALYGEPVILLAAGLPSATTGSVSFTTSAGPVCRATVENGRASCTETTQLAPGTWTVTATYSGDSTYTGSSATVAVTVAKAPTHLSLWARPDDAVYGSTITLLATGLPGGATGTVTFATGSTTLCTVTVVPGPLACVTPPDLAPGFYSIDATYSGDGNYLSSSARSFIAIDKVPTRLSVRADPQVTTVGNPVTFSATVSPATATGTVSFSLGFGRSVLCSATLSGGSGSCTIPADLPPGASTVFANYPGDSLDDPSFGFVSFVVRPLSGTPLTT